MQQVGDFTVTMVEFISLDSRSKGSIQRSDGITIRTMGILDEENGSVRVWSLSL